MACVASALLSLLLTFTTVKAFGIEDIVPDHRVVSQIGHKLALSCRTTDCESPYFSWRTQLDYPLGGKLSNQGKSSVLTIQSVGFQHEHQYLCTAGCKQGEPSKEKTVVVDIYSFPSDPVIELKSPLILGQPASVICHVPEVYPSEQLTITLKKGKLTSKKEFFQDPHTKSLQTKNLKVDFIPTEEDFEKEIVCIAELFLEDMTLKARQSTHMMEINFGPQNTQIVAFPDNTILEGEALTVTCLTRSHPSASFTWKKQLPDGLVQNIMETQNLFVIPNPQASDSGTYICEVTNEITSVVERASLHISVQASVFSTATSTLTTPSETTTLTTPSETTTLSTPSETTLTTPSETTTLTTPSETISFTSDKVSETTTWVTSGATPKSFASTASETAALELITTSTSNTTPKIITSVTSHAALKNNTVMHPVEVSDDDRNNTDDIILIARVEELDYVTPVIIVVSCLATVAGPAAAIFIYIFRKMKINGSYSLADSLKPNV